MSREPLAPRLPEVVATEYESPSPALRDELDRRLLRSGAVLLRNLGIRSAKQLEAWVGALADSGMEYREMAAPRRRVHGLVYTSTEHPPPQEIFLHSESSHGWRFPSRLFLCCLQPPESGGETPLADARKVFDAIPAALRTRFLEKKVLYVRNYGPGAFGFRWQTAFGTDQRCDVEAYCEQAQIEYEWRPGDRLRTRQVRPAALSHPADGEWSWFNHAAVFHVSSLGPRRASTLLRLFRREDLPNNVYYGDGAEIDPQDVESIRAAYRSCSASFPWRRGDLLCLDNLRVAHGRRPFRGERRVLAMLADPLSWGELTR